MMKIASESLEDDRWMFNNAGLFPNGSVMIFSKKRTIGELMPDLFKKHKKTYD